MGIGGLGTDSAPSNTIAGRGIMPSATVVGAAPLRPQVLFVWIHGLDLPPPFGPSPPLSPPFPPCSARFRRVGNSLKGGRARGARRDAVNGNLFH